MDVDTNIDTNDTNDTTNTDLTDLTDYILINTFISKNNLDNLEIGNFDGKILTTQSSSINSDKWCLVSSNKNQIEFTISKINNIFYIIINGLHVIDYKQFIIHSIILPPNNTNNTIHVDGKFGKINVDNCDTHLFKKMTEIIHDTMKTRITTFYNLCYYFSHV